MNERIGEKNYYKHTVGFEKEQKLKEIWAEVVKFL